MIRGMSVCKDNLYKWYYKNIRNQIVHYRSFHKKVSFTDEQWNILIELNFRIINNCYKYYSKQILELK